MEQDDIKRLLERYWQCETSQEDERLLSDFFSGDSVPDDLRVYKTLFFWKNKQKTIRATPVQPVVLGKPVVHYFYPVLKIAASVLIVLTLGISAYTYYQQEKFMDRMFSESASDFPDAKRDSVDVVAKASLQVLPEQDSLRLMSPQPANME